MSKFRRVLASVVIVAIFALPALGAETSSVGMLREMFEKPVVEWQQHLKSHVGFLDQEFFNSVGERIRWGIENNHVPHHQKLGYPTKRRGQPRLFVG